MSDELDQDDMSGWPVNSPSPGRRYPVVRGDDDTRYSLQRGWSDPPEPDARAEEEEESRRRARERAALGADAPASSAPSPAPAPVERVKAGEFFGLPAPGSIAAHPAAQTPPSAATTPSSSPVPGYSPFRWPEPSAAPLPSLPPSGGAGSARSGPAAQSSVANPSAPVPPPPVAAPVTPEARPSGLRQGFNNLLRGALDSGLGSAAQGINALAGNVLEYAPKPVGDALALGTAIAYPANLFAARSLDPARLKESQVHNYRNNAGLVEEGRKQVREALPVTQEFAESLPGQLTGAVGQAAGTLPLYALGPLGAMATVGQTYDQARADAEAHELTGEAAHKAALWNLPAAAIDVVADKFVVGRFLKGAQGKLSIGRFLTHLGESGAFHGLSAGAQQAWSNFVAKNLSGYDPERKIDEGVVRAFVTALATGHLVTGAGKLVGAGRALAERWNPPSPDAAREGHAPSPPPDPRPPAVSHPDDALPGRETISPFAAEHLGPAGRLREPSRLAPSEPRGVPSAGEGIVPNAAEEIIPPARPLPDPKSDEPNGAGKPAPELPGKSGRTPGKPTPDEGPAGKQRSPGEKPTPRDWGEVDAHADTGATVETRNGKRGVVTAIGEHTVRFRKEDGTIDAAHRHNARIIPRAEEGVSPSLRPAEVEASPSPTTPDEPPASPSARSEDLPDKMPESALESPSEEPPTEPSLRSEAPAPAMAPESARSWGDVNKGDVGQTVEDRNGRRGVIYQNGNGGTVAARGADGNAFSVPPGDLRIVPVSPSPLAAQEGGFDAAKARRLENCPPEVLKYSEDYYNAVNGKSQDLSDLVAEAQALIKNHKAARSFRILNDMIESRMSGAQIYLRKDARRWEFIEEFSHWRMEYGDRFLADEKRRIKAILKQGGHAGEIGRTSEELAIKQYLVENSTKLGLESVDVDYLKKQIEYIWKNGSQYY